ncbi:hypothetical protein FHW88_000375 [Mucilaginibacter sp. SG538B]|nr:hypothetical protein [Mucilaginibacter sp. SG538B]
MSIDNQQVNILQDQKLNTLFFEKLNTLFVPNFTAIYLSGHAECLNPGPLKVR